MIPSMPLGAITIAILLSLPAAGHAQQPACGALPANGGICATPTTPQFNTPTQPIMVPQPPQEVPVSPADPVPGSTSVGSTVNPNSGLSVGCTGQIFSASGC